MSLTTTRPAGRAPASPSLDELRYEGFEPLGAFTPHTYLGELWPASLRRSALVNRTQTDAGVAEASVVWMVRSPWPSMSTAEAVDLVSRWVDRSPMPHHHTEAMARAGEALQWTLADVRAFLAPGRPSS